MRFADDFLKYFAQNFSEDIFIHFKDGLYYPDAVFELGDNKYINLSTGVIQDAQPKDEFIAVKFIRAPTRPSTIGNGQDVLKDEAFLFNVRIFTPKGRSNKKAYEIEQALDSVFNFESIPATDARIYTEKDVLKLADEPFATTESVWSELRLSYRFFARYF